MRVLLSHPLARPSSSRFFSGFPRPSSLPLRSISPAHSLRHAPPSPQCPSRNPPHRHPLPFSRPTKDHPPFPSSVRLQSSATSLLVVAVIAVLASLSLSLSHLPRPATPSSAMTFEAVEGHLGNLTPDQEAKLSQLWHLVFKISGLVTENDPEPDDTVATEAPPSSAPATQPGASSVTGKPKRFGLFRAKEPTESGTQSPAPTPASLDGEGTPKTVVASVASTAVAAVAGDDKHNQAQQFLDAIANHSPQDLRKALWDMVRHDHPDAILLRFLRARKWDVDKALVMMISALNWRLSTMRVDNDVLVRGEGYAALAEKGEVATDTPEDKQYHADFLKLIRSGKSFLHGCDKDGRPLCYIRVRMHHPGDQREDSLERATVHFIETARLLLRPPIDTATVVFDMNGFSMANMDYTPLKFMIQCFEANYPECLGHLLVYRAPWIFQGVWRVIRGWIDPVVASKIHFVNNTQDLEHYIPRANIPREFGGDEDWDFAYPEPSPDENSLMKDTATRDKLLAERALVAQSFEDATKTWIDAQHALLTRASEAEKTQFREAARAAQQERDRIAELLRVGYWTLDPYVRARSFCDRLNVLQPGGVLNFYPERK